MVDGHPGLADATTRRVLVTLPAAEGMTADEARTAAALPATVEIDGATYDVEATTLPLVRIGDGETRMENFNRETFSPDDFLLVMPDGTTVATPAGYRIRGATGAVLYTKKSFAVKLYDEAGDDLDASLLGMRTDNSWILDAMASDISRLRNRATMDLWLDFATLPYYAAEEPRLVNGTRGHYVEAFLGDRYWGLYCLSEKVDRKQLRLKKFKDDTPRGLLYKLVAYDNLLEVTDPTPDNGSMTWQRWECSYPDVRKGEPIDWMPLLDVSHFLAQPYPSEDVAAHLAERVDLPLWTDYNLYCDLFHGDDNTCKNIYTYYRDVTAVPAEPLCICPWDLDHSWGRAWDGAPIAPDTNCSVTNAPNVHVVVSMGDEGAMLNRRWAELRDAGWFTEETIWPYFARYFDLFDTSGAGARETERWQGVNGVRLDLAAERDYIHAWLAPRIAHLDADYGYPAPPEGIARVTVDEVTDTTGGTAHGAARSSGRYDLYGRPAASAGLIIERGRKTLVR